MSAIKVSCPACKVSLRLAALPAAGKKIRCPKCSEVFAPQAPEEPEAVEEAVTEADDAPPPPRKAAAKAKPPIDDEDEEKPRRRRAADEDEDDRPKKKKAKQSSSPLVLILGGVVGLLFLGGVLFGSVYFFAPDLLGMKKAGPPPNNPGGPPGPPDGKGPPQPPDGKGGPGGPGGPGGKGPPGPPKMSPVDWQQRDLTKADMSLWVPCEPQEMQNPGGVMLLSLTDKFVVVVNKMPAPQGSKIEEIAQQRAGGDYKLGKAINKDGVAGRELTHSENKSVKYVYLTPEWVYEVEVTGQDFTPAIGQKVLSSLSFVK